VIDRLFSGLTLLSGAAVLAILAFIVWSTSRYAWPALSEQGWSFLTTNDWKPDAGHFGGLAFVFGTLVSSAIAVIIAVPISVALALFIAEVAPRRLRRTAVALVDLLAAVPSVVFGVVGLLFLRQPLQRVYVALAGSSANGTSFMTAGIVLAFMILPIITSVSREVFTTVPDIDKQGALALGATRWEMFRASILPYSYSGVTGATMLGLGRALGETIAVALVIGGNPQITGDLFKPGDTMAGTIANTFFSENAGMGQRALIGLGVVLFAITVVVNMAARVVVTRAERRIQGAA
jgi:phosphate transport system permease protein